MVLEYNIGEFLMKKFLLLMLLCINGVYAANSTGSDQTTADTSPVSEERKTQSPEADKLPQSPKPPHMIRARTKCTFTSTHQFIRCPRMKMSQATMSSKIPRAHICDAAKRLATAHPSCAKSCDSCDYDDLGGR